MPPEMLINRPFNGVQADIFSMGVILFNLVFGVGPFNSADINNDLRYQKLALKPLEYWGTIPRSKEVSESLILLITCMLQANNSSRPSIEDIKNCKWFEEMQEFRT